MSFRVPGALLSVMTSSFHPPPLNPPSSLNQWRKRFASSMVVPAGEKGTLP